MRDEIIAFLLGVITSCVFTLAMCGAYWSSEKTDAYLRGLCEAKGGVRVGDQKTCVELKVIK